MLTHFDVREERRKRGIEKEGEDRGWVDRKQGKLLEARMVKDRKE